MSFMEAKLEFKLNDFTKITVNSQRLQNGIIKENGRDSYKIINNVNSTVIF